MTMTLEQKTTRLKLVADGLRRIQEFESASYLDEYAAHIAGMGEPVAFCCPTDPFNSTAFSWPGTARVLSRHTMPLYTTPPIDLAAVRKSVDQLREACRTSNDSAHGTLSTSFVGTYLDDIEAYLTQPAQSVDVEMVREVIASLYAPGHPAMTAAADKLTAALQEKGNG